MSKNYFKKTLAGIFAFTIIASSIPLAPYTKVLDSISITASAAVASEEDFAIADNGTIKQYKGAGGDVEIPSTIRGVDVTGIGEYAFGGCESLTSVIIPKSVTSIGYYAFGGCKSLTSITIPDSVTSIGSDAFTDCINMDMITVPCPLNASKEDWLGNCKAYISVIHLYDDDELYCKCGSAPLFPFDAETGTIQTYLGNSSNVVIPSQINGVDVKIIAGGVFYNKDFITSITIPDTVTTISDAAFQNCTRLTSIAIPDSVTSIGKYAFYNCTALKSVTLPKNLTSIGGYNFQDCSALENIIIPDSVKSIGEYCFFDCTALKSVTMSNTVESIGDHIFHGCTQLESITLPDTVAGISNYAFYGCSSLTDITIPDSVTTIGNNAFLGCSGLTSIRISDSVTTIGNSAFFGCSGLTSIRIPDSVTSIGSYAFENCKALESITIPDSVTSIGSQIFDGCIELTSITAPCSLKASENYLQEGHTDANITYNHVYAEGENECVCKETRQFEFDASTGTITKYIGAGGDVKIPSTIDGVDVTSIGNQAFKECSSITSVTIPASVESIGGSAFNSCTSLVSITFAEGSALTSIGTYVFQKCSHLESIEIPASVESIGNYAFHTCTTLKNVTFAKESKLKSIGQGTFVNCALESITIPASVESIETGTFANCKILKNVTFDEGTRLKSIGQLAFASCALESITIPASVTEIGKTAFQAASLSTITFAGNMPEIASDAFSEVGTATAPATLYYPNGNSSWEDFLKTQEETFKLGNGYFNAQIIPTAAVKGASVSYNGNVTINFHYLVSESYKNGYVIFNDDNGTKVSASNAVKDTNGYCVFPISMPAKNMYDEITAQFYDENDNAVGDAVTFKMEDYLEDVISYDSSYTDFVKAFLEYGAQAAAYFGVENAPASSAEYDYDTILGELAAQHYDSVTMSEEYVGATMLLKSTPILRLYYKEEVNGLDLGDNEKWDTNEMNKDLTFIQKKISATNFATTFNGYSVYHYLYKALEAGDDDKLMKLCAALYEFSKAADAIS